MGTTADWRNMVFVPGEACLFQLLTDNLLRLMIYNFVQKCIVLATNNVMSVLAPI